MASLSLVNAAASWCNATRLRTALAAMLLAALSSLLILPVLDGWWHHDLRVGKRLADYMVNHGTTLISPGTVRLYMVYVPEWTFALPLGWMTGRFLYRHLAVASVVCGLSYVLMPWIFTAITLGGATLGFFQVNGVFAGVLVRSLITFILVFSMSQRVGSRQRRRRPGWCTMCGRGLATDQIARCSSCKMLCTTCRYDLISNTSGVCPECGTAIAATIPLTASTAIKT